MAKFVKLKNIRGEVLHPATILGGIADEDFRVSLKAQMSYYNVSDMYPTQGVNESDKFTFEMAINLIPSNRRRRAIKCAFIGTDGKSYAYEYQGGTYTDKTNWLRVDGEEIHSQRKAVEGAKNQAILDIRDEFGSQRVTPEMLSESTKQLINASGGGTITNFPDDEDLTSVGGVLKLADRIYDPGKYSGKGRKILRKNIIQGKNVLTQGMIDKPNTTYVIKYQFDLSGNSIDIPDNSVLSFEGGKLANGFLKGSFEIFSEERYAILFDEVKIEGEILTKEIEASWFGEISTTTDSAVAINKSIQVAGAHNVVMLPPKNATVASSITINKVTHLDGRNIRKRYGGNVLMPSTNDISVICIGDGFIDGSVKKLSIGIDKNTNSELVRKYVGIEVKGCESFLIENVKVSEADIAYKLVTATQISLPKLYHVSAHSCNKGVWIATTGTGWANGIFVRPSWFTNNYIHFHITTGYVTTIEGGNVEIGNSSGTDWHGNSPRGFLIEGDSSVNIIGCIWGENIQPVYAEAKDTASVTILGESWILDKVKVSGYAQVRRFGNMVNTPEFTRDIPSYGEPPAFYISANNLHKSGYYLHAINMNGSSKVIRNLNLRHARLNGVPLIKTLVPSNDDDIGLDNVREFTIGIKAYYSLLNSSSKSYTLLFDGTWGGSYVKLTCTENYNGVYLQVSNNDELSKNLFITSQTRRDDASFITYTAFISISVDKGQIVLTSGDKTSKIASGLDLSGLSVNLSRILPTANTDTESYISDFVCFNRVLTPYETMSWIDYFNDGGAQCLKVGNITPDTAPIGHSFYDTGEKKMKIKTSESVNEDNVPMIEWINLKDNSNKKIGTSLERPKTGMEIGDTYKDTTLGKWIIWNGTFWENIDGTQA